MGILLKGNFKSFTKLVINKSSKKTNKILLNIHGLYGLSGDPGSKSKKLAEEVIRKGFAHVVNFNSSRDWNVYEDGNWGAMKEAFKGKTFEQELQDVKDSLDMILDQSEILFGVKKKDLRFLVVGNSLGGGLATNLDDYFKYINRIVVAGSGTRTVMDSDLTEKDILKKASKFKGEVMLLQGSEDTVVPLETGDALLAGYKNAKTKKIVIDGANHQFSKINGKDKKESYKIYINTIISFLFNNH